MQRSDHDAALAVAAEALDGCPNPKGVARRMGRIARAVDPDGDIGDLVAEHPERANRLVRLCANSRYLTDLLVRHREWWSLVGEAPSAGGPRAPEAFDRALAADTPHGDGAEAVLDHIRRIRHRETLRIAIADLDGLATFDTTVLELSRLADAVVRTTLDAVGGAPPGLVVLALGKLGGSELNYSSDIDLVLACDRADSIEEATEVSRRLVSALGDHGKEGFLYRVDLRLRPHGEAGHLVVPCPVFLGYLADEAHPWERQAMLKARPIAGDLALGSSLLQAVAPLLFDEPGPVRRDVRALRARIERDLTKEGGAEGHIKAGPGGIRDVEFIVQALQLEHGKARAGVRSPATLEGLERLAKARLLKRGVANELAAAYRSLRVLEHRVQLFANRQVHRLPGGEKGLNMMGWTLGHRGDKPGEALVEAFHAETGRVRARFDELLPPLRPTSAAEIRSRVGFSYDRFGEAEREAHVAILQRIDGPGDVEVEARLEGGNRWSVTISTADCMGVLSLISGLFTAAGVDVRRGDAYSLSFGDRRKTLDTFEVRLPEDAPGTFWEEFRAALAELVALLDRGDAEGARAKVIDGVSGRGQGRADDEDQLFPVTVEVDNDSAPELTVLRIQSTDTRGFLFEFTNALAMLNVNIERVEVRTEGEAVRNTFWVNEAGGGKVDRDDRVAALRLAAALIKQFTHLLPGAPNPAQALRQFANLTLQTLSRAEGLHDLDSLDSAEVLTTAASLLGASEFLWEDFLRMQHENLFPVLTDVPGLAEARSREDLEAAARASDDINRFKDREMFRIDLRHITHRVDFVAFSGELSDLADAVIGRATELSLADTAGRYGLPHLPDGTPTPWCVLALGKFGGRELGFASDVELILVHGGEGRTDGDEETSANHFFEEAVRALTQTLVVRREGTFEIDLRLRPHGDAGSLATSMEAYERYFSTTGEGENTGASGGAAQFERMAQVRLRPVTGDTALIERVLHARDAFVYSGTPLDLDDIRHLRARQVEELVAPGAVNAKFSPGGLVDIEYFVQAQQILHGAANPAVRVTNTLQAIRHLALDKHLDGALCKELADAYGFLRRLIDALRVVRGHERDLSVPPTMTREFAYLARRLRVEPQAALDAEITARMALARSLWTLD